MKVTFDSKNQVKDNILSGVYYRPVTEIKGKLYEFSSPKNPISSFEVPYDAYLLQNGITGNAIVAVGSRIRKDCPITSDRSGVLYFYNNLKLIGTCHGFDHNEKTYYNGYNFYNAFYPAGYFSPPFGENISVFKASEDGLDVLNNGKCNSISATEYNELFGIISKTSSSAELLSTTLTSNVYQAITSPKEACPPELTTESYFDEIQLQQIPGTTLAIGGNNSYNNNPIPTSLDNFDIKVNGRFQITKDQLENNFIVFSNGRPQPSYSVGNEENKLNNALCLASLMETKISLGRGNNSLQLIEAPDALQSAIGEQVSFAGTDNFHYWHFLFKENSATLPFYNNFVFKDDKKRIRIRAVGEGTPLFVPILASEDNYWQNRQCPSTVDYLPWTFGASLYACPSEHFDIPYYAAVKKFGFYGTRFLNTCRALNLENSISGIENSLELPSSESNYALESEELEPDGLDKDGNWSFSIYDNLLKVAKAEERYANMYALNRGFFLWANSGLVLLDNDYLSLINSNSKFGVLFNSLIKKFENVFLSGLSSFTGNEPTVTLTNYIVDNLLILTETGNYNDILLTDIEFVKLKLNVEKILIPQEFSFWENIQKKYTHYIASGESILNENFYKLIISGKEKRLMTRYFENILRGNPIDLFPLNNVTFSYDSAKDYIEHSGWNRCQTTFGANSPLPEINRRYFEGAYGKGSSISGLIEILNSLKGESPDYYYPGFFQDTRYEKTFPKPTYIKALSGKVVDNSGRHFTSSGWLGLGYNEIGALDGNFSCFTPIYIQQPLPKVFCKIGQKPTFRTMTVDYHTIPEDKISRKYPEIIYWCSKLKLLDCRGNYLYPIKYKWFRVNKSNYEDFVSFGNFGLAQSASFTGDWGCLEGDGPECTMFHPKESFPIFTGKTREDEFTFIKGATKNEDDNYYYFCLASGRFGVRISNKSELNIEDWLRFDISVKNGLNVIGNISVNFEINDKSGIDKTVKFENESDIPNYGGYQQEDDTASETVISQKIPPPNAGWGDVTAYRFIGPIGYVGTTRTYTPSVLADLKGLRETWGHLLEYGQLIPFSKKLTQNEGDLLYGYKHLPTCEDYQMPNGKKGIKVSTIMNGYKVGHWSVNQKAVASLDNKAGIKWDKLFNLGELYPPIANKYDTPNFAIGHWQWGNNLGTIKRFGKFSTITSNDIKFVGGFESVSESAGGSLIEQIKDKLIGPTELAGENCGHIKYGLGRNMLYYIEAFERFYIICDPIKKKNVTNKSFICPGLRLTNSSIQYFWLGKPNNTFLKRRPMYGPYAYQWRVQRHNRDRNGNGISEGFYSMGYNQKYSLMYDGPATYGLYVKKETSSRYLTLLNDLNNQRDIVTKKLNLNMKNFRGVWFGERKNEGTSRLYGAITFSCFQNSSSYDKDICDYVSLAQTLANNINFGDHSCSQDLLANGECFDPCLSMRYAQGFFPGGKLLDLFGYNSEFSSNSSSNKNIKLTSLAKLNNGNISLGDEYIKDNNTMVFRNPLNTPHARISQGIKNVKDYLPNGNFVPGISPCQDGGSDHCNFITPTIHLGITSYLIGKGNAFNQLHDFVSNVFNNEANIIGELS